MKSIIKELDLFKKEVIHQRSAWQKDLLLLANKLIEKIPDPRNAKELYQSFIRKKNTESVKQWEIIFYQPKNFENPNVGDIKPVIIECPEIIRQTFNGIKVPVFFGKKKALKKSACTVMIRIIVIFGHQIFLQLLCL